MPTTMPAVRRVAVERDGIGAAEDVGHGVAVATGGFHPGVADF